MLLLLLLRGKRKSLDSTEVSWVKHGHYRIVSLKDSLKIVRGTGIWEQVWGSELRRSSEVLLQVTSLAIEETLIICWSYKYLEDRVLHHLTRKLPLKFVRYHNSKLSILNIESYPVRPDRHLIILSTIGNKQAGLYLSVDNLTNNHKSIRTSHPCAALYNCLYCETLPC